MKSITDIKNEFKNCKFEDIQAFISQYSDDIRAGVKAVVKSANTKYDKYILELERQKEISIFENQCYKDGMSFVAGIDEVGRGPLAGPVVASCVILPKDCQILGINDSKKLSAKKREELFDIIYEKAIAIGIGIVDNNVIDEINILQATFKAMTNAIANVDIRPEHILVDGNYTIPDIGIPQTAIIKGDAKSISIGAASIVAKVTRDRMMIEYSKDYPYYGFESNVGYGSKAHIEAIKKYGLCPLHRKTFTGNFV